MNATSIAFAPSLPLWLIAPLAAFALAFAAWGMWNGLRGAWLRAAAALALLASLFEPAALIEEREPLKSVVAVVTDRSGSQKLAGRPLQTDALREAAVARLKALGGFEVRDVEIGDRAAGDASTALFAGLAEALRDVPPDQVAGALLITDGQVHDIPRAGTAFASGRPVHALITGSQNDRDRRIHVEEAPRFAVVGEKVEIAFSLRQSGIPDDRPVAVAIRIDGETVASLEARAGETIRRSFELPHGGRNIVEIEAPVAPGEVTAVNNTAVLSIAGIRQNLRVLLVSGEPHAGERMWRNLLKSDPAVHLVHFTILRPPEKQDGTPINQLSLIAFPTRELFVEKIDEFDLIVFDRYRNRNVLPLLYFDNIARYVREGGALLVAAGPEFAQPESVAAALAGILPARPDGIVRETGFKAAVSATGLRHPVTRGLEGWSDSGPRWGRWHRAIGADASQGETVMTGPDGQPLLVLSRAGQGRVAMILTDQIWLWARGYDGGGPHVQLLRRAAHWLMKEPELDEERLDATVEGDRLAITRQKLTGEPGEAEVRLPSGGTASVRLLPQSPGLWRGELKIGEFGLYRVEEGDMRALAHAGPPNPREFAEVVSTPDLLAPVLAAQHGSVRRGSGDDLPNFLAVRPGANTAGGNWIGFQSTGASILKKVDRVPLFNGLLGLALLLGVLSAMWAREGR
jgi:hypothetical protein